MYLSEKKMLTGIKSRTHTRTPLMLILKNKVAANSYFANDYLVYQGILTHLQPLGPPGGTWVDQALRGECSLLATLPCVARSGDSSMGHGVGKTLPLSARRRHITEDVVTAPTAGTGHRRDWPVTSAPLPHTYILIFNP